MKLRALTLTNVRKFGGRKASLTGIGDGLTVVSEANEFGKSTFFDALHALFFQSHTSTAKPVKSLQPHAGGGVAVSAEVETPDGSFVIEKRFLSQKGASVRDLSRGAVIARDGEAEGWIARLIGEAEQGPAGLLWVRQGVVGLEPSDGSKTEREKLTEARRDLMSSVAGEIDQVTGGRRMDRILARCAADFDKFATSTGRPRGAWKEAADRAAELRAEHELLTAQCAELAEALAGRAAAETELGRLDDPAASAALDSDLSEARARMAAAESHAAKVREAEKALRIAELERDQAAEALARLVEQEAALAEAEVALGKAEAGHARAGEGLAAAREAEVKARATHEAAAAVLKALRAELSTAERAVAARKSRDEAEALETRLAKVRGHRDTALKARARVEANPATPAALAAAEDAVAEVARLDAAVQARAAALTMRYDGAARITLNGAEVPDETRLTLDEAVEIGLPGIGRMLLDLPAAEDLEELEVKLANARQVEAAAFAACGADSLSAARDLARKRAEVLEAQKLAESVVQVTAPEGLETLEAALAAAQEAATAGAVEDGRAPDLIRAEIAPAEEALAVASQNHERSREAAQQAHLAATRVDADLDAARQAKERAESALGPANERATHRNMAEAVATKTAKAATEAETVLAALRKDAPRFFDRGGEPQAGLNSCGGRQPAPHNLEGTPRRAVRPDCYPRRGERRGKARRGRRRTRGARSASRSFRGRERCLGPVARGSGSCPRRRARGLFRPGSGGAEAASWYFARRGGARLGKRHDHARRASPRRREGGLRYSVRRHPGTDRDPHAARFRPSLRPARPTSADHPRRRAGLFR